MRLLSVQGHGLTTENASDLVRDPSRSYVVARNIVRAPESAGWRRAQRGVVTRGSTMRRSMVLAMAAVTASGLLLAGCGSNDTPSGSDTASGGSSGGAAPKVGVILPDTKSSARWETADAKYLKEAFEAAGVDYDIQNAQGDATPVPDDRGPDDHERRQRPHDRQPGLRVGQGGAAEGSGPGHRDDRLRPADAGRRRGLLRVVRQHQGRPAPGRGPGRSASTDAGKTTANIAFLNGSPTDNNATLFKPGAVAALQAEDRQRRLHGRRGPGRRQVGQPGRPARSSSRCGRRTPARSTASSPPTTVSATPRSPS